MKKNGKNILIITGILEILIAIISVAMVFWILKSGKADMTVNGVTVGEGALRELVLIYGVAAFEFISGVIALIYANNESKYKVPLIFGVLLVIMSVIRLKEGDSSILSMVVNYSALLIPSIYTYGAIKNKVSSVRK